MHPEGLKLENISNIDIQDLIPQRAPMLMVSGLVSASDKSLTSSLHVEEGNIFVENGVLRENALIENIAQTAAALNGYRAILEGGAVKNGYIGSIKKLEIKSLPKVGKTLNTVVAEIHNVMDTSIILGEVRDGDVLIARCEMSVFIQS